jgi:hypothetical protein
LKRAGSSASASAAAVGGPYLTAGASDGGRHPLNANDLNPPPRELGRSIERVPPSGHTRARSRRVKALPAGADEHLMIRGLRNGDQRGIRISDGDRDLAAQRLREALAEGRITIEELEARLDAVHAAVYAADLRQPLAELPDGDAVALPVVGRSGADPTVLRVGAAGLKRAGEWIVPARLQVKGGMGSVTLDFCKAEIRNPIVQIELKLGTGSVQLLLPNEATADVDGVVATIGAVNSKVPSKPKTGATHFVVSGHTRMGSVTVRRRREFAGLRF